VHPRRTPAVELARGAHDPLSSSLFRASALTSQSVALSTDA
jgi:hypothetical protein